MNCLYVIYSKKALDRFKRACARHNIDYFTIKHKTLWFWYGGSEMEVPFKNTTDILLKLKNNKKEKEYE